MVTLETPIEDVPKISKRIVPALKRLGIRTIRDLLFHFPARYDDFSNVKSIDDVVAGETVTIEGILKRISTGRTAHKRMALTEAVIEDETGRIKALWFNQPFLERNLKSGMAVRLSGKVSLGKSGPFLSSPVHEKIRDTTHVTRSTSDQEQGIHTGGLVPVYPETAGISSRWLRFLISSFLPLAAKLSDPLPVKMRENHTLPELRKALHDIHFPDTLDAAASAQRRFTFEELLLIQLHALKERSKLKQHTAPHIFNDIAAMKQFVASLPFALTDSQRKAIWEILTDIAKPIPMNRLLEGDVGSGKTIVSAAAAYMACQAGYQTAVMAPTEILARQHFATFQKILAPFDISVGLLTGSEKLTSGNAFNIVIGTHALIQKTVLFKKLGLIIIDEQHRFGVEQRAALITKHETHSKERDGSEKKVIPHFLSMTATPIPRTLALTIYGDLDLSLLDESPKSRKKIITQIVKPGEREKAYAFIQKEIAAGGQAFVVCPQIEIRDKRIENRGNLFDLPISNLQSLSSDVKAVKQEYEKLSKEIFPNLRIAMLHGKMKPKEKKEIMEHFKDHKLDILVSTSVIEVGVDVPNANIMVIEGAERFGLAQLHQFRGRVGRGEQQSYCILFPTEDGAVTRRLQAIVDAKNGFELAEYDLKIRGPGSMFGTEQWGISEIAKQALADVKLIQTVRNEAIALAKQDPTLANHPILHARLAELESAAHLE
ncbi:MAG: ATP-dependent DNA helicase RecG [Candidatus Sungbacteria bacterium]|nr:ATP-dependent DNA helicase RecG [Candidatus Sungbacteria bacterium]